MPERPSLPISEIVQIAANSALARVSWDGGRGRAPLGYIKGMAVMFAVVHRKLALGDPAALEMSRAASSDRDRDALAHYASRFAALGMRNDASGIDTLRHLFVLMIGLGMRESFGRYCEGYDRSASNTSADSAEAGLFQMTWDVHRASRQIPRLLDEYQENGGGYREIFCEGVTPHRGDLDNFGSGTGLRFQQLCKDCPGFAVEAAAVGLRNLRTHWGPINRREAELRPEAEEMLQQVQRLVTGMSGGVIPVPQPDPVQPVHDAVWLQRSLNALGAEPRLAEDAVYGRLTVAAVVQFQQQNGLSASGVADAATIAAIERKLRPAVPGPIPSGPADLIALLERLVMLLEKQMGQRPIPETPPGSQKTDQLGKALDLLKTMLSPGTASTASSARTSGKSWLKRLLKKLKAEDVVDFSVFGPPEAPPGESVLIQVFLHLTEQAERVSFLASAMDSSTTFKGTQSLQIAIERGARVDISFAVNALLVDEPVQSIVWQGQPAFCQFVVTIPLGTSGQVYFPAVRVSVDGQLVGCIKFRISSNPVASNPQSRPLGDHARRYEHAFVSYATKDRAEVLKRVQMLQILKTKFFQDFLSLEPGDRWEKKLYQNIDGCDLFLLFWSKAAKDSKWVIQEAEYALQKQRQNPKNEPDIVPVILQQDVLPPPSLAELNFNDRIHYLISLIRR